MSTKVFLTTAAMDGLGQIPAIGVQLPREKAADDLEAGYGVDDVVSGVGTQFGALRGRCSKLLSICEAWFQM